MAAPPPIDAELLKRYGLEGAVKTVELNPAMFPAVAQTLAASGLASADTKTGNLLFNLSSGLPEPRIARRDLVARYVGEGKLINGAQLTAAMEFFKKRAPDAEFSVADFEAACGSGVTFTDEQLAAKADEVIAAARADIVEQRFLFLPATLLSKFSDGLWRWADRGKAKALIDERFAALVGPRTPEDDAREAAARESKKKAGGAKKDKGGEAAAAGKGGAPAGTPAAGGAASSGAAAAAPAVGAGSDAGGAFEGRELTAAFNTPALLAAHAAATGGKVRTRFPPEPNGFLHIGHAKSMNLNFEGAFRMLGLAPGGGETIFRYDDTNPDAESQEYIDNQAENVSWMGWRPARTTHSSDYFPQLYEAAVELIRLGKAYVCHMTREEMEASREIARARDGRDPSSPWRNRSVEENLREFQAMRDGRHDEGKAVLRLKIDMGHVNPTLWDPVAYRIKLTPHPMTGGAWCIYPSYDFSHSLIDSLENIDYSLCTLEFEVRRELYYWVLEALGRFRPTVWEFSRLNITRTVLSKRKILKLVTSKTVRGWDDPRLLTINGLRRRGYPAEAINAFCRDVGVTRNDNTVGMHRLEHHCREFLDTHAKRVFVVLRPLRVTLTNMAEDWATEAEAPDFPRDKSLGSHRISLTRTVFIEREDFRDVDAPDFYGLAPGKTAGLRYAGYVTVTEVVRDPASGAAVELRCSYDHARTGTAAKVKGNLHWVSGPAPGVEPPKAEVRLYDYLFTTDDPGAANGGDWEAELNPASETVLTDCRVDARMAAPGAIALWDRFQFERLGFFVADKDSDFGAGRLVFNQTVTLKEDAGARKLKGGGA